MWGLKSHMAHGNGWESHFLGGIQDWHLMFTGAWLPMTRVGTGLLAHM